MDKDGKVKIDIRILSVLIIAVVSFLWLFIVTQDAYNRLLDHAQRQNEFIKELIDKKHEKVSTADTIVYLNRL